MSENRFAHLAPAHIQNLVAYDPGHEPSVIRQRLGLAEVIELGSNENSLGPAPAVLEFLANPAFLAQRYPDAGGGILKAALSAFYGLEPRHFTLGNGTHELLTLIAETFCAPGDEVLYSQYGFAVYRLAALGAGATPVAAPAGADLGAQAPELLKAVTDRTKLLYLANPNNPTGTQWSIAQLREFLLQLPSRVIFILDEAYVEYVEPTGEDSLALLRDFPNLVIARTFSKAYALAGLRVGYTIAHPDFANMLERTRLSFNVNSLALRAAALAIGDQGHIATVRAQIALARAQLRDALSALGLRVLPSQCNFVLVHFGPRCAEIEKALVGHGVIVRPMRGYGLPDYLRITVGTSHENHALIRALRELLPH